MALKWQIGILSVFFRVKPDIVWIAADLHFLSSFFLSIVCKFVGTKFLLHGQGFFKNTKHEFLRTFFVRIWCKLSKKYVAYADISAESMINNGFDRKKIVVIQNRFQKNSAPKTHVSVDYQYNDVGVLFIGRLRFNSKIALLIDAIKQLNIDRVNPIKLHIIGDGDESTYVKNIIQEQNWVIWYGAITDNNKITEIANSCSIGVYPGKSGLSILSFLQYGLPVILNSNFKSHMGPEASYIIENFNGWFFKEDDINDLKNVIKNTLEKKDIIEAQNNAVDTFNKIHSIRYSDEWIDVLNDILKKKVVFVWGMWGPYHHARFKKFYEKNGSNHSIALQIYGKSKDYIWNKEETFDYNFIELNINKDEKTVNKLVFFFSLIRFFKKQNIDVAFVPSYWPFSSFIVLISARLCGVKCIMMNESHKGTEKAIGVRKKIKTILIKLFEGALVGGKPQIDYFIDMGIDKIKILAGYDVVDNDYFINKSAIVRENKSDFRYKMGLPNRYFLSLGRMIEKKNLYYLINAYSDYFKTHLGNDKLVNLVIVGYGELENDLKLFAKNKGLLVQDLIPNSIPHESEKGVFFGGASQIETSVIYYSLAMAFVFPSKYEEWGLVVNEAMACKLPVFVSDVCGCADDLVEDGKNGHLFSIDNTYNLERYFRKYTDNDNSLDEMGFQSQNKIREWSCDLFSDNAIKLINMVD